MLSKLGTRTARGSLHRLHEKAFKLKMKFAPAKIAIERLIAHGPQNEYDTRMQRTPTLNKVAPMSRQLCDGTALRIEGQCDLLRTFRARDCDSVHLVLALNPEIRPTYLTQQQQR